MRSNLELYHEENPNHFSGNYRCGDCVFDGDHVERPDNIRYHCFCQTGKYIHLIGRLDRSRPIEYDPVKDPNYLSFYAVDSLGGQTKVIYHNTKPAELEMSERIVMRGKMNGDIFECKEILLKCPSKYKDDPRQQEKGLQNKTQQY